jgi:hypothetical protein
MARQVADQTAYAASYGDPVRAVNPYTPTELVTGGQAARLPIVGVLLIVGLIVFLEHRRRRRGR